MRLQEKQNRRRKLKSGGLFLSLLNYAPRIDSSGSNDFSCQLVLELLCRSIRWSVVKLEHSFAVSFKREVLR